VKSRRSNDVSCASPCAHPRGLRPPDERLCGPQMKRFIISPTESRENHNSSSVFYTAKVTFGLMHRNKNQGLEDILK
jgi:hypothetical protein